MKKVKQIKINIICEHEKDNSLIRVTKIVEKGKQVLECTKCRSFL